MTGRLNLAFLGCGGITAQHSRTLSRFRHQVRCFYASRSRDRAMAFERRLGGAGSFGSYDEALADGWIDAVLVATPPSSHLDLTLAALRAGKDVIVEKPAFLAATDVDTVRQEMVATGRRVLVAENYAYKPLARVLRRLLAEEAVGDLRFVRLSAVRRQAPGGWRGDLAQAGGGALFEGGVHWIDLLAHLGPAVRTVRAFRPAAGEIERSLLLVVEYAGGGVGTLHHSWEVPSPLRGLGLSRIDGTAGSIVFESNGLFVMAAGRRRELIVPGLRDLRGYQAMFHDLLEALRTGGEPLMTLERARRGLEIVEEAYSSALPTERWPAAPRLAWSR
jgi:predicted dehydrogenase